MYYIICEPNSTQPYLWTDSKGFVEVFSFYEHAKTTGNELIEEEDIKNFEVVGVCSDERNHII